MNRNDTHPILKATLNSQFLFFIFFWFEGGSSGGDGVSIIYVNYL